MTTVKIIKYEMPAYLPGGWQVRVAERAGWHRNTVYNIKKQGESHPLYKKMKRHLEEMYGKPIETETI